MCSNNFMKQPGLGLSALHGYELAGYEVIAAATGYTVTTLMMYVQNGLMPHPDTYDGKWRTDRDDLRLWIQRMYRAGIGARVDRGG